jgi:hypothetical protein
MMIDALQTLEFAGASRQLTCVELAGQEVAFIAAGRELNFGPNLVGVSGDGDRRLGPSSQGREPPSIL